MTFPGSTPSFSGIALAGLFIAFCAGTCPGEPIGAERDASEKLPPAAGSDRSLAIEAQIAPLVKKLGNPRFTEREAATQSLFKLGDIILPSLKKWHEDPDPEVQRRVRLLETCLTWHISPELLMQTGELMWDFEKNDWMERQEICRVLGYAAKEAVIPTLLQIIKKDSSPSVRRAAIASLYRMGEKGMSALVKNGIDVLGPDPFYVDIFISLGNRYLSEKKFDLAENEYKKALRVDPANSVAAYNMACVYSLRKQLDKAVDWLERSVRSGFDDFKWMRNDPDLKNLQGMPRYEAILKNRGVPSREPRKAPETPPDR